MKKFLSLFTFLVLLVCFSANAQEKAGAVLVNKDFTTCTPAPVPTPAGDPSPVTLPSGWSYIQSPRRLQVAAPIATQYYNYFAPTIVNYQNETFLGITQQGLVITPANAVSYQQLEVQVVAKVQGAGDAASKLFFGISSSPAYGTLNVEGNTWKTYNYHYVQLSTGNITMGMIEDGGFTKETLSNVWVKSLMVKKPDIEWPESVWATDIEKNTCTAHCEEVADATTYEWVIGTPGFDPDGSGYAVKVTSNTPSKAVTGLTENTAYDIYARAKNSSYTSHWSPKSTFKTNGDCSYYQNFNGCEDQPIVPDAPNIDLVGWSRYNNYANNAGEDGNKGTRMSPSLAHNGHYTVSSSDEKGNALKFYFSVSTASKSTHTGYFTKYTDQYAILPARSFAKLAQVTFKYRYSSSVHHSEFYVGVMVSPTDPNSFTPLATIASHSQTTAYVNKTVNLASYEGEGQYIAFKVPYPAKDASGNNIRPSSNQSGAWTLFIDDVGVDWKVKRPSITSVTSSEVTWTSQGMGEKGKYELVLSPTALTPEQLEDPEAYGATIHEFPQNTLKWTGTVCPGTYYAYVQEISINCDNEGWSTEIGPYIIAGPSAPTNLAASSITTTGATVSWTGTGDSFEYILKTTNTTPTDDEYGTEVTANSAAITGLTACTTYYVWVRSKICSTASAWSTVKSFTTECDGFTITFKNNTDTFKTLTVQSGETFTFPDYPTIEEGYQANGWTATQIPTFQKTANASFNKGATSAAVTGDATYYLQKKLISDTYYTTRINTIITSNTTYTTDQNLGNVSIKNGTTMTVNGGLAKTGVIGFNASTTCAVIVNDGGKLLHYNKNVPGKVVRHIVGPEDNSLEWYGTQYGWYFISAPLANGSDQSIESFITNATGDYDIEYWDVANSKWINQKYDSFDEDFITKKGYIAAYQHTKDFAFSGILFPYPSNGNYSWTVSSMKKGQHNLIGNRFCTALDYDYFDFNQGIQAGYAIPDPLSATYTYKTGGFVKPGEGFMIYAEENSPLFFYIVEAGKERGTRNSEVASIDIHVTNSEGTDNAILLLNNKTEGYEKLPNWNDKVSLVYVNEGGKVISINNVADNCNEKQLKFVCKKMGKHTITMKTNGVFNYLHLIDRVTGNDIDMLLDGSYEFTAAPGENVDRFIVRFVRSGMSLDENDFEDESFVTISNNEIFVSGIEGEGTIDIFDVMGRHCANVKAMNNVMISADNFNAGVYMVRLSDNNGTKVQKIIVK